MSVKSRKIYIWLFSLIVVVLVYLLISFLGGREPIKIDTTVPEGIDSNTGRFGSEVGKIGEVGVLDINNPVYRHANAAGQIDREFGFKKLVRTSGDLWDVDKPFINFFRSSFDSFIIADKGSLQMENVAGQPVVKDASLSGNVVVHIVPKTKSSIGESFIYLDDISFESDTSVASTAGAIRFESEDIQMTGKGLEFVYDKTGERLEFLRIPSLDNIKLKVKSSVSVFPGTGAKGSESSAVSKAQTVSAVNTASRTEQAAKAIAEPNGPAGQAAEKLYRWTFNKNVVIEDPRQLIFTDRLVINDISLSGGRAGGIDKTDSNNISSEERLNVQSVSKETASAAGAQEGQTQPETVEILVKCDGGILVTPVDSNRPLDEIAIDETVTGGRGLKKFGDPNGRGTFESRRIDYSLASNTAVFEGDCSGAMLEPNKLMLRKYTISAPRIEARMRSKDSNSAGASNGLEHIRADGGTVQLAVETIEEAQSLGFTKITSIGVDYDVAGQIFSATGPGMIAVNNSKVSKSELEKTKDKAAEQADRFSLKKPCWAIVENFDALRYDMKLNQFSIDSAAKKINIGYMPVVDGKEGPVVRTSASHIDVKLIKTAAGQTELLALKASGGISYEEEAEKTKTGTKRGVQFVGSDLIYSRGEQDNKPVIKAWGNESWPCFLNGVLVDGIEYNLTDGTLKETKILGPGMIW